MEIDGEQVKVQIWDTAGQEQYHSITTSYFQNTAAALLVYEVNNRATFEDIQVWLNELHSKAHEGTAITLIGNKCDMPDDQREVTFEEA
jgi:small GTP-binding protein